jgi:hypothetical protein
VVYLHSFLNIVSEDIARSLRIASVLSMGKCPPTRGMLSSHKAGKFEELNFFPKL